ncbi:MAG TPA: peptide-methionine (S)-S-oxide reductase, partial [Myxococcota bacterium]
MSLASLFGGKKLEMVSEKDALPGRDAELSISPTHTVLKTSMKPPFPAGFAVLQVGMGCFWGAERKMWQVPG